MDGDVVELRKVLTFLASKVVPVVVPVAAVVVPVVAVEAPLVARRAVPRLSL